MATVDFDARPVKCQNCQLARFKSNISHCLQFYTTVCSSLKTQKLNRDRTFMHKTTPAENALSASTDDGGIQLASIYQL